MKLDLVLSNKESNSMVIRILGVIKLAVLIISVQLFVNSCATRAGKENYTISEIDSLTILTVFYNPDISDYTPVLMSVLEEVRNKVQIKILFESGSYSFFPEHAMSRNLVISNNDSGDKKVVFDLKEFTNIEIDGRGSDFVFYGGLVPFHIFNSTDVHLCNFSIKWDSPFVLEGMVINNDTLNKIFDIKILEGINYKVESGYLQYQGYDWSIGLGENIVYDPKTKRPIYNTAKYEHNWSRETLKAEDLGGGVVRLSGTSGIVPPIGSIYTDKGPHGANRLFPAIFANQSVNISIEDVNIYDSGAMGFIAQKTENVSMTRLNVILESESKRMISASADATHFVNCKGEIRFDNCRFENMLDDATNVHGTYQIVADFLSPTELSLTSGHYQQDAFPLFSVGDSVALVDRLSLNIRWRGKVKEYNIKDKKTYMLTLEDAVDRKYLEGSYVVENLCWKASLTMKNCTVKQNRARSILISTTKPVLIENNYFSSMMAAIRISGDANYWFESGETDGVVIKNNTFEDIGIGGHAPQAVLQIDPVIRKSHRQNNYYHKNIVFTNNVIKTFDPLIVYALSVDGLTISDNEIIQTKTYKPIFDLNTFDIINCKNVIIKNNVYQGKISALISVIKSDKSTVCIHNQKGFAKELSVRENNFFYQD